MLSNILLQIIEKLSIFLNEKECIEKEKISDSLYVFQFIGNMYYNGRFTGAMKSDVKLILSFLDDILEKKGMDFIQQLSKNLDKSITFYSDYYQVYKRQLLSSSEFPFDGFENFDIFFLSTRDKIEYIIKGMGLTGYNDKIEKYENIINKLNQVDNEFKSNISKMRNAMIKQNISINNISSFPSFWWRNGFY